MEILHVFLILLCFFYILPEFFLQFCEILFEFVPVSYFFRFAILCRGFSPRHEHCFFGHASAFAVVKFVLDIFGHAKTNTQRILLPQHHDRQIAEVDVKIRAADSRQIFRQRQIDCALIKTEFAAVGIEESLILRRLNVCLKPRIGFSAGNDPHVQFFSRHNILRLQQKIACVALMQHAPGLNDLYLIHIGKIGIDFNSHFCLIVGIVARDGKLDCLCKRVHSVAMHRADMAVGAFRNSGIRHCVDKIAIVGKFSCIITGCFNFDGLCGFGNRRIGYLFQRTIRNDPILDL